MNNPNVMVVVPAFNSAKTIKKTIDSILAQSYDNFHVVAIDDCSTDETPQILHSCRGGKHQLTVLHNDINVGVSKSRNRALETGASDLIAYCDSDDWWDVDHLRESVFYLQCNGADMVYSTPEWVDEAGNKTVPNWEVPQVFDANKLKQNNYIWTSTVLHRSGFGLFDTSLDALEDWDMWLQALRKNWKIFQKPSCTAHYLVRVGGLAGSAEKNRRIVMEKDKGGEIKLNLGCGDDIMPGWVNIDVNNAKADVHADVSKLPFPDDYADVILASHIIEHFTFHTAFKVLAEWKRVLKPGGKIIIETPDLLATCDEFVKGDEQWRIRLYGQFFAFPDESKYQTHYFLYTQTQLGWTLQQCGFNNIARVWPNSTYSRSLPGKEQIFLRMEATK